VMSHFRIRFVCVKEVLDIGQVLWLAPGGPAPVWREDAFTSYRRCSAIPSSGWGAEAAHRMAYSGVDFISNLHPGRRHMEKLQDVHRVKE